MSRDSDREVARCKREMLGCGKGDLHRSISEKFHNNYPECSSEGCFRLKLKDSMYCSKHQQKEEK